MLADGLTSVTIFQGLVVLFIATITLFLFSTFFVKKRNKFPPGPTGLPIVGYLLYLTKKPHLKFQQLAKKYGSVFSVQMGSESVVVLNSAKDIREAYNKAEFLGRPTKSVFSMIERESPFFLNGKVWQEQRRFSFHALKDLGLGKSKIQQLIKEEIRKFIEVIETQNGTPCNIRKILIPSISNNICSLVFGCVYEYDDPNRLLLDKALDEVTAFVEQTSLEIFFPWMKYLPFLSKSSRYKHIMNVVNDLYTFIEKQIDDHKRTLDVNNIRDYIDSYLVEMQNRQKSDPETTLSDYMLAGSVSTLFGTGSETIRTSIEWCLYAMAAFQDVQKEVQTEIDAILSRETLPSFSDMKSMKYVQSVLMEMQRWQTVAPISLLRCTLDDTSISKYNVPKDTLIIANLWAVHRDPEKWKNPNDFIDDRFLSPDKKSIIKVDEYMPFSVGKRSCPGEHFAMMELFMYFVAILQHFDVHFGDCQVPDFEGVLSVTYNPKIHKLCLIPRL